MKYSELGATGVRLSALTLDCMSLTPEREEDSHDESERILGDA